VSSWAARRAKYWATRVRACVAGASTDDVILHHRHYRQELGRESASALVPLCRRHHAKVHQRAAVVGDAYSTGDLALTTDLLIARSRRRWRFVRDLPPWRPGTAESTRHVAS
jgi:hypothetical protein